TPEGDRADDGVPLQAVRHARAQGRGRLHDPEQGADPAHVLDSRARRRLVARSEARQDDDARDVQEAGDVLLPLHGRRARAVRHVRQPARDEVKLVVVLAAVLVCATAARATTQPGTLYVVRLVITDHNVVFRGDKFLTKQAYPHYPRATDVRYEVRNRTSRPLSLNILGSVTGVVKPGAMRSILVYWGRRGRFVFRPQPGGPPIRVLVD